MYYRVEIHIPPPPGIRDEGHMAEPLVKSILLSFVSFRAYKLVYQPLKGCRMNSRASHPRKRE
jgi:hypothetical protein